jgi:hypothetical protein
VVNVGGLIAAAGSMSSENFLANRDILTNLTGPVENHGKIEAGVIGLFGQRVVNGGTLRAPDGLVTLVAGNDVYIGRPGGNVVVKLEGRPNPLRVVDPGIDLRGAIVADEVDMRVGDLHSFAMGPDASVTASDIRIAGLDSAFLAISGTLDARGTEPGAMGGSIAVRGPSIALAGATLDASGMSGGGSVMIGGAGSSADGSRAANVSIDAASSLAADAMDQGRGGHISVDALDGAVVAGRLSARGGPGGGDGGFIEMSGQRRLDVAQMPDVAAPRGKPGEWLLSTQDRVAGSMPGAAPFESALIGGPVSLDEALEWLECVMNRDCDPDRAAFDDPRLATDEQQKLRQMYAEVFGRDRQTSGRRALLESVEAFRARPAAGDEVDAGELLRFLRASPEESSVALRYLAELAELVAQWKRTQIGVTDADRGAACMLEIGLQIDGLRAGEIYALVTGTPLEGEARCR